MAKQHAQHAQQPGSTRTDSAKRGIAQRVKTAIGVLVSLAIVGLSFYGAYRFAVQSNTHDSAGSMQHSVAASEAGTSSGSSFAASSATSAVVSYSGGSSSAAFSGFSSGGQTSPDPFAVQPVNKTGIDVSEAQGTIDWDKVAADGIDFAFVRVGYRGTSKGDLFVDANFKDNLQGAKDAGLEVGVYFFSQAITVAEAEYEAGYVLKALKQAKLDYPVVFDYEVVASGIETRVVNVASEEATKIAEAFCATIEQGGYQAMIYGNTHDLAHFDLDNLKRWDIWYAEYNPQPAFKGTFAIWQYSSTGQVDGIDELVDLNLDMRTYDAKKPLVHAAQ